MDGAYKPDTAGEGVIIKDHDGDVRTTMAMHLPGIKDANHAEIIEIWCGLDLAKELLYSNLIIESDCSLLVYKLQGKSPDCFELGHFIESLQ
ncbi:hypothetical protein M9H77_13114 [Catharanthus roseus]|uniref:Uncharacterized protein n=1 Tax=Catharanthus roseus TaxID=4058 RepID=A0ACC0BJE1_CATRO|nr:hypothetical protein M9H77_13114 [Catharanthus roseus]